MTEKDRLWSPDSQIVITNVGYGIPEVSVIAAKLPLEPQLVRRWMLTWPDTHFGWSAVERLRSRAVMTPATLLCYKPQVTVLLDKHSVQKSQFMVTLEMAQFRPVTSAWETARSNMAVSTSQQTGFNRLSAVETSKAPTTSASGVTGTIVMEQWWWLVEEEVVVQVLIMGLE